MGIWGGKGVGIWGGKGREWEYKLEVNGVDRNLGNGIGYRKGRDRNRGAKGSRC